MKRKAQNIIEVICLVSIVLVVVVAVFMYARGGSPNLANMSKINGVENGALENTANGSQNNTDKVVGVETAGSLSGTIAKMSKSELAEALANKSIDDLKAVKTASDDDIFDVANALITELSLSAKHINKNNLNDETKSALVNIAQEAKEKLNGSSSVVYTMYTAMLAKIIE